MDRLPHCFEKAESHLGGNSRQNQLLSIGSNNLSFDLMNVFSKIRNAEFSQVKLPRVWFIYILRQ